MSDVRAGGAGGGNGGHVQRVGHGKHAVVVCDGWEPGVVVMRELEGRVETVAGTFNEQDVANTLWTTCVSSIFGNSKEESLLVHTVVHRMVFLGKDACLDCCFWAKMRV